MGRTGRRGVRVPQRPRAPDRHLPVRAPDVRDRCVYWETTLTLDDEPVRGSAGLRRGSGGRPTRSSTPRTLPANRRRAQHADRARASTRRRDPRSSSTAQSATSAVGGADPRQPSAIARRVWSMSASCSVDADSSSAAASAPSRSGTCAFSLTFVDQRRFASGVVYLRYRLATQPPPPRS